MARRFNLIRLVNAQAGQCSSYGTVRAYVRDSQPALVAKARPFYMLSSSYTVASDPNTMRNQGEIRNAQYRISDHAEAAYASRRKEGFKGKESLEEERRVRMSLDASCPHRRPQSQAGRRSQ